MQVSLDSAVIDEVGEAKALGVLHGVTTNPTLALKSGRPFEEAIKIISELVGDHGTVSRGDRKPGRERHGPRGPAGDFLGRQRGGEDPVAGRA